MAYGSLIKLKFIDLFYWYWLLWKLNRYNF